MSLKSAIWNNVVLRIYPHAVNEEPPKSEPEQPVWPARANAGHFDALPWQVKPWSDTSAVMVLSGGSGCGKTTLAIERAIGLCLRYPNYRMLYLLKHDQLARWFASSQLSHVCNGGVEHAKHNVLGCRFDFANGSSIYYGGMDSERSVKRIDDICADGVVMDDASAFDECDFEVVLSRLRGTAAGWRQVTLCVIPCLAEDGGPHWIYKRLIVPFRNGAKEELGLSVSCYFAAATDNHNLAPNYVGRLAALVGRQKDAMYHGVWAEANESKVEQP